MGEGQQARAALGRASVLTRERAAWTAAAVVVFIAGYYGVGALVAPERCLDLRTALDTRIPFWPRTVWLYLAMFPVAFLPLFVVRCPTLFRRTLAAYAAAFFASLITFVVLPVGSEALRAAVPAEKSAASWVLALVYRIDPPCNLFPSLHVSIALLAAASAWKARRRYGALAFAATVPIIGSILTVKQHVVADAAGAIVLAGVVGAVLLRPYRPAGDVDPAFGRAGALAFAAVTAAAYAGLYAAYRLAA